MRPTAHRCPSPTRRATNTPPRARPGAARNCRRARAGPRPRTATPRAPAPLGRASRDQGVTAVEFAGWLPILFLVALAGIQFGLVGYAAQQASSGARAAARVAAQHDLSDQYRQAGQQSVSGWLDSGFTLDASCGEVATVTASVTVPSVLPFVDAFGEATKSVTMPCD